MLCSYVMLCYAMLFYFLLCYVTLRYAILCYVMLCYVMLYYVMLCYVMLCYVMLKDSRTPRFCPSDLFARFYVLKFAACFMQPGLFTVRLMGLQQGIIFQQWNDFNKREKYQSVNIFLFRIF